MQPTCFTCLQARRRRWRLWKEHSRTHSSRPALGCVCSQSRQKPAAAQHRGRVMTSQRQHLGTCRASPSLQVRNLAGCYATSAELSVQLPGPQVVMDSGRDEIGTAGCCRQLWLGCTCSRSFPLAVSENAFPAGFVSCGQLQGVVGSSHARAAAAWAKPETLSPDSAAHRVVMRGPGASDKIS